jgi:signal transduction histidine kinase
MTRGTKAWLGYSAAWVPLLLFYMYVMMHPRPMLPRPVPGMSSALVEGLSYVLPVALLGTVVWWLVGKLSWPPTNGVLFIALHSVAALAFAGTWVACEIAAIAMGTGVAMAIEIAKTFIGFQFIEGVYIYGLLAAGSHAFRIASKLRDEEALRMRAELAALRGQLNPHFLFNTLHTLTALVRRDPDTAEHALERFGDMLRYVLDVKRSQREDVTLADELAFVRTYLSLEQLRLGDRLRVVEDIDPEALDCTLPSLTLQPLVENAIKYGIATRANGGSLEIMARFSGDMLHLEVSDDGPGARRDVLDVATGVGLRAVRQRLETRYRGRATFGVTTAPGEGFIARVAVP